MDLAKQECGLGGSESMDWVKREYGVTGSAG